MSTFLATALGTAAGMILAALFLAELAKGTDAYKIWQRVVKYLYS